MLPIKQIPSPNFNERKNGTPPSMIILHYTDTTSAQEALDILCDPAHEVSAHYMITEDGKVIQMVDETKRAWHAGRSYWRGITDINSHSIGIELCNPGHLNGYRPFPDVQINVLIDLCKGIMARWDIRPENVLAHSDIAPARKKDPGELFPWDTLAAASICTVPENTPETDDGIYDYALKMGFDPNAVRADVVTAFKRRYLAHIF